MPSRKACTVATIVWLCLAHTATLAAPDFVVATNGNDAWSGALAEPNAEGTDGPFATLARARDAVREAKAALPEPRAWTIALRGGVHELAEPLVLSPEDSGAGRDTPVTFAAFPGEQPIVSGGSTIGGWGRQGDLFVTMVPEVAEGRWYFHQLFVDGQRRTRARHPNQGFLRTAGNLPEITDVRAQRDEPAAKMGFTFHDDDLRAYDGLGDVNVVLYYDWSTSRHWVSGVDAAQHTVRFANPTGWPVCWWEREQRYHVENARELLDEPGEWYLDRETGVLTYWPFPDEDLTRATVVAPRLERLIELRGDPAQGKYVENVRFEGIAFEYADWAHDKTQQAEAQAAVFCTGAIFGQGARGCSLERCEVAHVGEYALWLEAGCSGNRIVQCEIRDMGAGGIRLGSEGPAAQPGLESEYNTVDNCFIHDAGNVFPDGVGIWVGHSSGNQLTHNEICDIVYSGISVGWSWGYGPSGAHHNIIEWNHIHHLGFGVLSELSAIYTLGVSPGTRIANNLLHDTYDYRYGSWGIGLDEGTSGVTVENNTVYNHGYGIGLNYGHGNLIRNNIVAFCRGHDLINGGRDDGGWSMRVEGNVFLSDAGVITTADWHARSNSTSDWNLFWDTDAGEDTDLAGLFLDEWQTTTGQDAHSEVADPLFADAPAHNFRLQAVSPALALGFQPFDLSGAGLYGDPDWVAAPSRIDLPPIPEDARLRLGPLVRFEDGFEDSDVGAPPRGTQVYGETNGASVRVTDEVARTGSRSLRLVDAAGLEATWQPHFVYSPSVIRGVSELSFDARLGENAVLVAAWRDWRAEMLTGPHITLRGGGMAAVGEQAIADVPADRWVHVVMLAAIGARAERKWRLVLTQEDGTSVRVDDLPMESDTFRQLTWIGFISDADGPAVTHLDSIRLRYGKTEAELE